MIAALAIVLAAISIPPAPTHYVTDTVGVLAPQREKRSKTSSIVSTQRPGIK